ncbi:serine/threonine-protein kinase [Nocardia sp. NPDC058666]|uniref:serine/threonine-protein kinase n=1 Tax=unclassified Nocardia TaxID=2637762 RepID=UPI003666FDF6
MPVILRPGTVFAGYVIERVLGNGGMGTVYAARHPRLPRLDALKILSETHSAEPEFRARFIREAELAARIDHPNVIAVHDRGLDEGALWISMRLVAGTDAAALLRSGLLQPPHAVHIITEAAAGLDAAHRAGLLHRDVKPANLMLEPRRGEPDRVLVADFGIAKAGADSTALTQTGTFLATLAYAAPELIALGHVDHRADVYSLGCTLFELLTGRTPFPRETPAAVIAAHLHEQPPRATDLNPQLPPAIDAVLARALAKDRDARYSTCGALAAATNVAFGPATLPTVRTLYGPTLPPNPNPGPGPDFTGPDRRQAAPSNPAIRLGAPIPTRAPRKRTRIALATVTVGAVAAAVGFVVTQRDSTATPPPTATTPAPTTAEQNWGAHQFVADPFPALLPKGPFASGYQGIRCAAVDRDGNPLPLDQPPTRVGRLTCNGDRNPVERVAVSCNADRLAIHDRPLGTAVVDQGWERPSGRGHIIAEDRTIRDKPVGLLSVTFDDVLRSPCVIFVYSDRDSARELFDRWWPDAPL